MLLGWLVVQGYGSVYNNILAQSSQSQILDNQGQIMLPCMSPYFLISCERFIHKPYSMPCQAKTICLLYYERAERQFCWVV